MIRWGILGAGRIAKRFAASLAHDSRCALVAVSGRTPERAAEAAAELGAERACASHEELLAAPDIDAIYLALPHSMHKPWLLAAIEAGKPVLCEKAFCLDAEEAAEVASAARASGVLVMEAMKTRFSPTYRNVCAHLDEIGKIVHVDASLCSELLEDARARDAYHVQPVGGGCLLDCGVYCAGWIEDLLSGALTVDRVYLRRQAGIDAYVEALYSLGDATARLECAFDRAKEHVVRIAGEHGTISAWPIHRPNHAVLERADGTTEDLSAPFGVDDLFDEICHFNDLIEADTTESPIMPLDDTIRELQLLDAATEALACTQSDVDVILEQERILRYPERFGSAEALALGSALIEARTHAPEDYSIRIVRERDGVELFAFAFDGCGDGNMRYMDGKLYATRAMGGHASLLAHTQNEVDGSWAELFEKGSPAAPNSGAFPIRVGDEWVATVVVSGLHEGRDHELVVHALEKVLGVRAPEYVAWAH